MAIPTWGVGPAARASRASVPGETRECSRSSRTRGDLAALAREPDLSRTSLGPSTSPRAPGAAPRVRARLRRGTRTPQDFRTGASYNSGASRKPTRACARSDRAKLADPPRRRWLTASRRIRTAELPRPSELRAAITRYLDGMRVISPPAGRLARLHQHISTSPRSRDRDIRWARAMSAQASRPKAL